MELIFNKRLLLVELIKSKEFVQNSADLPFPSEKYKMAKIPEAEARLFKRVFICKDCKAKKKADQLNVLDKKVQCRKCGGRNLRVLRKK